MAVVLATGLLIATAAAAGAAADEEGHAVLGTFTVDSDIGGAVWTFRDDGVVRLIGPGGMFTIGEWRADADAPDDVVGTFEVETSLQSLAFRGTVSPDGSAIALLVIADEPGEDAGRFEWPPLSMLVGVRLGLVDVTPTPSAASTSSPETEATPAPTAGAASGTATTPEPSSRQTPGAEQEVTPGPDVGATPMETAAPSPEPAPTPMPTASNGDCAVFGDVATGWEPCVDTASPAPAPAPAPAG